MAAEALSSLADVIDSQDIGMPASNAPHLMLLPVAPGRIHAHWQLSANLLSEGRQILGVGDSDAKLVLRAYHFDHGAGQYAEANSAEDFPVEGLENSGYFDLDQQPRHAGAVLGLKNGHGHFRPLVRAASVALPQPAVQSPPTPREEPAGIAPTARQSQPSVTLNPLDEASVVARLPRLCNLPEELLKTPDELAFFNRETAANIPEADTIALTGDLVLDESAVHEAIISGNCKVLTLPQKEADAPHPTQPSSSKLPESVGASELLASQWSDNWDSASPINLRAELTLNGRLGPGMKLALADKLIAPLPGGAFKVVQKLSGFAEVMPLLLTAYQSPNQGSSALELIKGASNGQPILEIHASIAIEGRINDESYLKLLPPEVKTDEAGRFELNRSLPDGALLLPGLSLIAEA